MRWKRCLGFGLALCLGGGSAAWAQAPSAPLNAPAVSVQTGDTTYLPLQNSAHVVIGTPGPNGSVQLTQADQPTPDATPAPTTLPPEEAGTGQQEGEAAQDEGGWGPTPLQKVNILQNALFGCDADKACIHISGWADFDYTYRSTGPGQNNIAPVMNRFGDEGLVRQLGLYITKPLDEKTWSWGFNAIFIAGADASFLGPTAGWYANTDPRFGTQFTDLNLTAHLPILTDGGVDIKAGRQTTVLGPMGALPWQRYFDSSDYAWYNLEEGRYTGISANWYITKQLSWYNGIEIGGWGVFFDDASHSADYITQINYWLDEKAEKTKVWMTILTGPTGFFNDGNTTTWEFGIQHNFNKYIYDILDHQGTYSKAPIFFNPPPGYQERAYDVYNYLGAHLTKCLDVNTRLEWYEDVDGGGYPGGFGIPKTNYFAATVGLDYHPYKWVQLRPEIRYDRADHDAFGELEDKKDQLSIAGDVLFKF